MIKIELLHYTPKWIESFKQEKRALQSFIGKDVAIEHIGSTAVPGLVSKPTIDLLIGVSHIEWRELSLFISEITSLGYDYIPEYETHLPERKYFEKVQDGHHIAHIHLVKKGGEFWKKHLFFRNILQSNQQLRSEYGQLKQALARREWKNRNDYANAKSAFISEVLNQYDA